MLVLITAVYEPPDDVILKDALVPTIVLVGVRFVYFICGTEPPKVWNLVIAPELFTLVTRTYRSLVVPVTPPIDPPSIFNHLKK